jgi:hypothetical protein
MDAATAATVITGLTVVGKPTLEVLKDAVGRIVNPSADAIGQGLSISWKQWAKRREENAARTVIDAATILVAEHITPQAVPGRILLPILESSSVEEDDELHQMWARLLAGAADPGLAAGVLPAFPHLLRELSSIEVQIIEFVLREGGDANGFNRFDINAISQHFEIDIAALSVYKDNLERLNLLFRTSLTVINPPGSPNLTPMYLTSLAYAFLQACRCVPR